MRVYGNITEEESKDLYDESRKWFQINFKEPNRKYYFDNNLISHTENVIIK